MSVKAFARSVVSSFVGRFGYSLVETARASLGDADSATMLARHLRTLFPAAGIDMAVDVGANEGQYYGFLRDDVGFTGPILSFEPNPVLAAKLRARAASDRLWTVFDCALGRSEATMPLNLMTSTGWSSLLDKRQDAETARANTFDLERKVSVRVRSLDDVLAELPQFGASVPYLKVDAQGFDLEVLHGAQKTMARAGALQTELEFLTVYDGAPSYTSVLAFLRERQYEITGVYPVWWDTPTLRLGEMDGVFRNMARVAR